MNNMSEMDEIIKYKLQDEELIDTLIAISVASKRLSHKLRIIKEKEEMKTMEKNNFYKFPYGIIECSEKLAKLCRLLTNFVPQFICYSLGVIDMFDGIYNIDTIRMTIY